jgi:hypothetical protein
MNLRLGVFFHAHLESLSDVTVAFYLFLHPCPGHGDLCLCLWAPFHPVPRSVLVLSARGPCREKLEGGIGTLFHLNLFDDVQGPVNRLFDLLEAQPRGFPWA